MPAVPPSSSPSSPVADGDVAGRLSRLEAELAALCRSVEELRLELAREVRTGRLVLADGDGPEGLVVESGPGHRSLSLRSHDRHGATTAVELFAHDPADGQPGSVGVALGVGGDVVATLEVVDGGEPVLWLDGTP